MCYEYQDYMRTYCAAYECPYPLALAVAEVESHFDMDAVGAAGEVGIMQLNPGPENTYWINLEAETELDPTTPSGNIAAGCYLLGKYMQEYGDANKAAMAYNMGVSGAENAWAEGITSTDYSTAVGSKAHTAELVAILSKAFAQHTMDDISGMFARADIAYDRVQHIKEVLDDPQALENMYIVPMANKDGTVTKQPATPIRFALTEPTCIEDIAPTMDRQAPMVGEHSAEILREYGYSDADIERFLADKVITIEKL